MELKLLLLIMNNNCSSNFFTSLITMIHSFIKRLRHRPVSLSSKVIHYRLKTLDDIKINPKNIKINSWINFNIIEKNFNIWPTVRSAHSFSLAVVPSTSVPSLAIPTIFEFFPIYLKKKYEMEKKNKMERRTVETVIERWTVA